MASAAGPRRASAISPIGKGGFAMNDHERLAKLMSFDDVEAVRTEKSAIVCRLKGREVCVPIADIAIADDMLWKAGDRGRLILSRRAARELGLA
jgi:hypothetical protein